VQAGLALQREHGDLRLLAEVARAGQAVAHLAHLLLPSRQLRRVVALVELLAGVRDLGRAGDAARTAAAARAAAGTTGWTAARTAGRLHPRSAVLVLLQPDEG